jgi:hypothetical protein
MYIWTGVPFRLNTNYEKALMNEGMSPLLQILQEVVDDLKRVRPCVPGQEDPHYNRAMDTLFALINMQKPIAFR